ncbi:MAG TPA: MBL fold metallo-hydrolase [Thermoanaerobaculia bacterium]|jgi:L-ascorbate metabolism protein UlaG (beta-lactamase superfamily)|nr:MBL fold metallo-hydrolase [Thermoanaerobaculia bacterium]
MTEDVYLRPNVLAEPLVCNWYAWTHLIQPVTAGRNVLERHLNIMRSFTQAPQVHQAAVRNPAMLGGPFISYGPERVKDIAQLIDTTLRSQGDLLVLARAVNDLDGMLRTEAKGFSLEPLYSRVPEPLRGFVELVYDLNHNPSFRLLEPLLYRSSYYDTSLQSLALCLIEGDRERPFVLSTPRLAEPGLLFVERPFDHPAIDQLFAMKRSPRPYQAIKEDLGVSGDHDELFRSFFTSQPPAPYQPYSGAGIRTRYFGHACILVEARGVNLLSDPVLSYEYHADLPRYTYSDLPDRIDYVLITHNHQDHVLLETMLQLRHKIGTVIVPRGGGGGLQDPSLRLVLRHMGFRNVIEIEELESLELAGGTLTGIPFLGEHSDLDIRTKMAYLVRLGGANILLAADSCNIEPRIYQHVQRITGDVDILFLGMECDGAPLSWMYGPLITRPLDRKIDHSRRLSGSNYERGIDIVRRFNCRQAYVYAMGMEPWLKYIMAKTYTAESDPIIASNRLIEDCRRMGLIAERLYGEKEIAVGGACSAPLAAAHIT